MTSASAAGFIMIKF